MSLREAVNSISPLVEGAIVQRGMMRSEVHDIIVIGASAGGVEALCEVTSAFPADLPASVFIVMHVPAWSTSALPQILSRCGPLPAVHPQAGEPIEQGRIYVAPPDRHLLVNSGSHVELWHGPKENRFRPAVNTLFRSAAATFGPRVTGVILSGSLEDGAAGLWWVKRRGGIALVQEPNDAKFPQMPQIALNHVQPDYVVPASKIGPILADLANGSPRADKRRDEGSPK
jgi:two-component system, chemotaxis family, protein-glutamate methylesterase/glutaminase